MSDYTRQVDNAYAKIADKGAPITFQRPPAEGTSVPADPDAPWEGNADDPDNFDHVALIVPLSASDKNDPDANHQAYVPGKGLPFAILRDQEFTDNVGNKYVVKYIQVLAPNPAQVILYTLEVALWPAT